MIWIDGLNEVIRNLFSDGFFHHLLGFIFGNHHHGQVRLNVFYARQSLQTRQTGHTFVQKNDVNITVLLALFQGIVTIANGDNFVAFFFQKHGVGFEKVNFVVRPKDFNLIHKLLLDCFN